VTKQTVGTTVAGNINAFSPAMNAVTALSYNQANRLAAVTTGTTMAATYTYDAFGQKLVKTLLGVSPVLYQFDQSGNLLEEGFGSTVGSVDYIYLGTQPVATLTVTTGAFAYLHTDHLGTPQLATGSTQATVWSAGGYQPFGTTAAVTGTITQNLRFPGQYFDAESTFYHNGYRDYASNLGRYLQSDPVGVAGGLNTYRYTDDNPVNFADPSGRCPWCIAAVIGGVAGGLGLYANNPHASWLDYAKAIGAGALFGATGGVLGESIAAGIAGGGLAGALGDAIGQKIAADSQNREFCLNGWEVVTQGALGGFGGGIGNAYAITARLALEEVGATPLSANLFGNRAGAAVGGIASFAGNMNLPDTLGGYNLSPASVPDNSCGCH
jgi:RHS repeat-associated protein